MNILGYDYKLSYKKMYSLGEHKYSKLKIVVDKKQHPQQLESTILHEVLHAISAHLQLDLSEKQVAGLEVGLYQTLTNNSVDLSPLRKEL